jgi:hypothetical protein
VGGVRYSKAVKNESVIETLHHLTPANASFYEKSLYKACMADPDAY